MEPIDKNFLTRIYGLDEKGRAQNGGYLYEYIWKDAYAWDHLGSELRIYAELFEAKTHEDEAPAILWGDIDRTFKSFNETGLADPHKCFCNERMDDELQKVLRFARERGPYVLREAGKGLGWPEADRRQAGCRARRVNRRAG